MHSIDVVGLGVRSPFGCGPDALFDGLCRRDVRFEPYGPFVEAGLRHPFAASVPDGGLTDAEPGLDRGSQLLQTAVWDALRDATGRPDLSGLGVAPSRIGLFVGTSSGGIGTLTARMRGEGNAAGQARYSFGAEHVAKQLGVLGPVQVLCSVCASSAQAIEEAASWLSGGSVDLAIAAGYDALEPFVAAGFDALRASADRATPFRAQRRGLVLGEAGAALVLARRGHHAFNVRGTLVGWGSASDAFHLTAPHPEGIGVAAAVRRALRRAGLLPSEVDAINAHGTATVYNDRMEARALTSVFGARAGGTPVYTVKGTMGHTLGAAGAVEAVAAIMSMWRGAIPPTVTEGDFDPACDLDLVESTRALSLRHTVSISAGFGGVNCALVLGAGGQP